MKIGMQARLCLSTKGSWLIQASAPPLPPRSAHTANPTYMVLKGHVLSGHTHVGLRNARLNNHLSQEL